MKYRTTPYILEKDGVYYSFQSEKDACDFLGVPPSCVSSAYRHGIIYHGFNIIKPLSENDIYNNKRLRKIWESMHERCEYEKHPQYIIMVVVEFLFVTNGVSIYLLQNGRLATDMPMI